MEGELRSFGHRLLMLANVLGALAASVFAVLLYLVPETVGHAGPNRGEVTLWVKGSTAAELAVGCAASLLVLNVLSWIYGRRPKPPLHHVLSDAPGGTVKVSREALETGLRSAGEILPPITRLRVAIEHGGMKKVLVRAQFQSPEGVSILEASRLLRTALSERFKEMVRLTDGGKVDYEIEFVGFAGKLNKKPAEPTAPKEESSPFTGPKYPIDDEDPFEEKRG